MQRDRTHDIRPFVTAALVVMVGWSLMVAAQTGSPSIDCSRAEGEVEELICGDDELAKMDRRLAEVYATALAGWPADEVPMLKAVQRGWVKGRNECWKAEDVRGCVESSYRTRTVELQIQSGQLEVQTPVGYVCEGREGIPFFVVYYRLTEPPSAVLTVGNDQVIAFLAPSGSGARYVADNVEFWEHHGEASVEWFGTSLTCNAR